MTSPKRALVTGGAGLIGSHLADLLIEKGWEVTLLDNLESQTHPKGRPSWLNPKARFIQGSVTNESDLDRALEGVQFVFHQAAFGGFTTRFSKYAEVNVVGTTRIFERIRAARPIKKLVVASSQAVYNEGTYECPGDGKIFPPTRPFSQLEKKTWEPLCPRCGGVLKAVLTDEEKPTGAETPYALSKEYEERQALALGKQRGVPVAALRYGVTYGPRQSVFNPYTGVVSIFSTRILNGLPPVIYEDGLQTRDFIYVGDIARANLFVMENASADFQVFNVGTGKATPVAELVRRLNVIYGKSVAPETPGQFRWGDVRHIVLNPARLNALGFRAATSLDTGLALFAEWVRSQGPLKEYFTEAYDHLKKSRVIYG